MNKIAFQQRNSYQGELQGHPVEHSAEAAMRRRDLVGRRLAVPVAPLPGEGLADLFLRATIRNGYQQSLPVWQLMSPQLRKLHFSHHSFLTPSVDDQTIADFLGTPKGEADIGNLRCGKMSNGVASFFGTPIRTSSLARHRRVSPRFLAQSPYQKAIWSVLPLCFDPVNREYLLDRCPICDVKLTFGSNLGLCFCHACADLGDSSTGVVDLRDYPQGLVQLESFENLDFACALIDPGLGTKRDVARSLHPDLRIVERGQIFEFIALIGRLLDEADGSKGATSVSANSLHTATAAVRCWPGGVMEIADKVRDIWRHPTYYMKRGPRHPISGEMAALKKLFGTDFIKMVRNQLSSGIRPTPRADKGTDERTARFRRSHPTTTLLGGFDTRTDEERLLFVSVLVRKSRLIRSEAKVTGLPFIELIHLYEKGLALCPDHHVARYLRPSRTASSDLYTNLLSRCKKSFTRAASLYDLATCLSDGRVPWPSILQGILEGKLAVQVEDGKEPLVRRIGVTDIEALRRLIASPQKSSWTENAVMRSVDAGFYLGISEHEVSTLVTSGLLPSGGIKFSALCQFRLAHVCAAETLRCLESNNHPVTSTAAIFYRLNQAGIPSMHSRPSVRERNAVREYLSRIDYRWK
jgi:hypothetical protein